MATEKKTRGTLYTTNQNVSYRQEMQEYLASLESTPTIELVNNFAKYAGRQEITRFLAHYELFRMVQDVQGSIVECGVFSGQGLMAWAQLSAIFEPVGGAFRKIYGFDTFAGFPSVHSKDTKNKNQMKWKRGDLKSESFADLERCIELFDKNRFLPQFPKVELIRGDFTKTASKFIRDNPHVLISLLYLDFDIFEPTKKALELFLPRMPKGAVLAFDEINMPHWPGETLALLETLDLRNLAIKKFPWDLNISYAVL